MFQKKMRMMQSMYLFGLFLAVSVVGFLSKHVQKSGLTWGGTSDENFLMSSARADGPSGSGGSGGSGGGGGGGGVEGAEGSSAGECGEGCEGSSGGGGG